jgi:hypothetical protein
MFISITDEKGHEEHECHVWFSGNEIILYNHTWWTCAVFSQQNGQWMYRHHWKEKRVPVQNTELIAHLHDLNMQKAIEKSMKQHVIQHTG